MKDEPYCIVISDYRRFLNTEVPENMKPYCNLKFKHGYHNVYEYSPELDLWLDKNDIKHTINTRQEFNY
jgi:hypothetical protein